MLPFKSKFLSAQPFKIKFINKMANKFIAMTVLLMALNQDCLGKQLRFPRDVTHEATETTIGPQEELAAAAISGNTNRLVNLIRLPLRLKALAHILSDISEGLNLINPSNEQTRQTTNVGHVRRARQGLLEYEDDTLYGDYIYDELRGLGDGALYGDYEDDVISGGLGGFLGHFLRSSARSGTSVANGQQLVNQVLNGVFDSVEQFLGNLLLLLENLSEGVSKGLPNSELSRDEAATCASNSSSGAASDLQIANNTSEASGLNHALARLNAFINALNNSKQEIVLIKDPCATPAPPVIGDSE